MNHVILPPWAKQDVREFIRVHRQALECDYVSQHLHLWIDLIFGCKQQGNSAVEATNVFHHLFYEGNVDIYNIDDPLKKNATIGFINNFGQIPKQLFKKPHPCKKMQSNRHTIIDTSPLIPSLMSQNEKLFFHSLDGLKPVNIFIFIFPFYFHTIFQQLLSEFSHLTSIFYFSQICLSAEFATDQRAERSSRTNYSPR